MLVLAVGAVCGARADVVYRVIPLSFGARAINAFGHVLYGDNTAGSFLYRNGGVISIPAPAGGTKPVAYDLNDADFIVGYYTGSNGQYRGMVWTEAGGSVDVGNLPGGLYSALTRVNASGAAAGLARPSGTGSFLERPCMWTASGGLVIWVCRPVIRTAKAMASTTPGRSWDG